MVAFRYVSIPARGAGRADFIQPSLGPLQPNFEDLMDLDLDFLNFPRLAPVPEEGSEDILKAIDYNYTGGLYGFIFIISVIMVERSLNLGFSQMNSDSSIQEINDPTDSTTQQISSHQISSRTEGSSSSVISGSGTSLNITQQQQQQQHQQSSITPSTIQYSAKIYAQSLTDTSIASSSATVTSGQQQQQQLSNVISSYLTVQQLGQQSIVPSNVPIASGSSENTTSTDEASKDSKQRFSRSFPRISG